VNVCILSETVAWGGAEAHTAALAECRALVRDLPDGVGVLARKVVTVHNGIDCARFRPDAHRRAAARRSWGVPENAVVIGAVGRLSPEKRHGVTIGAVKRLAARLPDLDLRLVLVGDGTERTALGEEALPLALLEAMACGCCAVAAGVGGVPEVLTDPRAGCLVPPGDDEAFTAALDEAARAGARVVTQFDAGRQYAALADPIEGGAAQAA
jgi:glycosyltransferase involved in cell wall biosynthesis